jgi:hypothetical protein
MECVDDSYIYGGIQDRGDVGFDLLGDVFLKNIYTVHRAGIEANCRSGMSGISALALFTANPAHS